MPVRILQIVTYMGRGGLETMLMNCYRHIDRTKIQFDFLVHRDFRADYDDEIEALGGKIYRISRLNPISPSYKRALRAFFQQHPEYKIVHCHLDCMSAIPLAEAKKCGIPLRIAHSHNSNQDRDWKYQIKRHYMKKIPGVATHLFACSTDAGNWMFPGQPVTIIKNGIETANFTFSPDIRKQVRDELHISSDTLVLGHVGRFMPQKNHDFLIDIFSEVCKKQPHAMLLLIGEGPQKDKIRDKVQNQGLSEQVLFLGSRSDVNRLLQAMDLFLMPSLYEGLGIAAIEAQASGLYCLLSDGIPLCTKLTDYVDYVSLEQPPEIWANLILSHPECDRTQAPNQVAAAGCDIQSTAAWLQQFYLEHMENV